MKRPVAHRIQDAPGVIDKAFYARERCFTVLGEALRHAPDAGRAAHPDVPWGEILGMRNRITHDYLFTDREMLWRTVRRDFPAVRPLLQRVLDAEDA